MEVSEQRDFHYRCLPRRSVGTSALSVRSVQPQDIEPIREWRNAQLDVLRQSRPISPDEQVLYYAENVWPEMDKPQPANILLAIEEEGRLIGYGGLVHVSWEHRRAEISFLQPPGFADTPDRFRHYFGGFLRLMEEIAFGDLGFRRLHAETYAFRELHIAVFEEAGFRREGALRDHVLIDGKPVTSQLHGLLKGEGSFR